jgi:hypothetical protein
LCDAESLSEEDLVASDLKYPDRTGETYSAPQAGDTAACLPLAPTELCSSPRAGLLFFFLDNEADLSIDAVHRDLVVLDDAFGILDPQRFDAAQGLRRFFDRLFARLIKPLRRLGDDLDAAYDRHCILLC